MTASILPPLRTNRLIAALLVSIGGAAFAGVASYVFQGQAMTLIERASNLEAPWTCVNGRGDLLTLRHALGELVRIGGSEAAAAAAVRAQIFAGRLDNYDIGVFAAVIDRDVEAKRRLEAIRAAWRRIEPSVIDAMTPEEAAAALGPLRDLTPDYDRFCIAVTTQSTAILADYETRLRTQRWESLVAMAALGLAGLGSVLVLIWQGRRSEAALEQQRRVARAMRRWPRAIP